MSAAQRLVKLVERYTQWRLTTSPEYATSVDVHDYNNQLEDCTVKFFDETNKYCSELLDEIESTVNRDELDKPHKFLHTLLCDDLNVVTEGYKWRLYSACNPINFLENLPNDFLGIMFDSTRFESSVDFVMYAERLKQVPIQKRQQMELMKLAMENDTTLNDNSISELPNILAEQFDCDVEKSVFYKPILNKLPGIKDICDTEKQKLIDNVKEAIKDHVNPCLRQLSDFINNEYLPKCRKGCGVSSLKDGHEFYEACLRWHTTYDMTAEEVHEIGTQEVARIRDEMKDVMGRLGFEGTVNDFNQHLKEKKEFFHTEPAALLQECRNIIDDHILPKLKKYFPTVPNVRCRVRALPYDGPGGMYMPGSSDGERPGIFFVNVHHVCSLPRYTLMALILHESVPGHHFQFAASMAADLPKFHCERDYRKSSYVPFMFPVNTAYEEGWALYVEALGEEMGMYRDDYERYGRLCEEMLRAVRLVVDTGLHAREWSRERAVAYMKQYCAIPNGEVQNEVDRYITWPGQACAYKVGEIKIRQLRRYAEDQLQEKFDIKAFHWEVLSLGPVPLRLLEKSIKQWVAETLAGDGS